MKYQSNFHFLQPHKRHLQAIPWGRCVCPHLGEDTLIIFAQTALPSYLISLCQAFEQTVLSFNIKSMVWYNDGEHKLQQIWNWNPRHWKWFKGLRNHIYITRQELDDLYLRGVSWITRSIEQDNKMRFSVSYPYECTPEIIIAYIQVQASWISTIHIIIIVSSINYYLIKQTFTK